MDILADQASRVQDFDDNASPADDAGWDYPGEEPDAPVVPCPAKPRVFEEGILDPIEVMIGEAEALEVTAGPLAGIYARACGGWFDAATGRTLRPVDADHLARCGVVLSAETPRRNPRAEERAHDLGYRLGVKGEAGRVRFAEGYQAASFRAGFKAGQARRITDLAAEEAAYLAWVAEAEKQAAEADRQAIDLMTLESIQAEAAWETRYAHAG